jgi:hypothetical protein
LTKNDSVKNKKTKEVKLLTESENRKLVNLLNEIKYKIGLFTQDSGTLSMYMRNDSARLIKQLSKLLISRGLLDKKMEIDFKYIADQLKKS